MMIGLFDWRDMRQVEHVDFRIDMDAVLAELPERHQSAMVMYMEGYSQREVGAKMGIPRSTIRNWLHQFRTKMHSWVDYRMEATCDNVRVVNQ